MHIKLAKYKIFLRKGALPPCSPRQGASPWTPVNASRKRSVCSLRSQLFEAPPMLKIFLSLCYYNLMSILQFASKMLFFGGFAPGSPLDLTRALHRAPGPPGATRMSRGESDSPKNSRN